MKFRKKPVEIEAIPFEELVTHGIAHAASLNNGVPWAFEYKGHPITHETDDCYLIPTLEGTMRFNRGEMLITGVKGEIYPCKLDIFEATYERVEEAAGDGASNRPPHQQRVIDERTQLAERTQKLGAFIDNNALFKSLPDEERERLCRQHTLMLEYWNVLEQRIAAFPA